jgi:hypothetical protein
MLTQDQIQALRSPFPPEALSADISRGFELTSIKAAYVIERLNEVFGACGIGWRYAHSPFEELQAENGRVEIVTEVAFQYRFKATNECVGCDPVVWDAGRADWAYRNGHSNHDWSEPIFASGGKLVGKGSAPLTDARKSAVTDGLTKAASMIGVGHDVFKGLVRVGGGHTRKPTEQTRTKKPAPASTGANGGNGHKVDATAFWKLFNGEGRQAGVSMEAASELAGKGNWAAAYTELQAMITGAAS